MPPKTIRKPKLNWRAFEAPPGLTRSAADWKRLLGQDFEALMPFLRPRQGLATSVPCPARPPCGCDHGVVEHGCDDIVSVCRCSPKRCRTTPLQRLDAVVWEVNPTLLGTAIAAALSIKYEERLVDGLIMTRQVGSYAPRTGMRIPLFLTIQTDSEDFKSVVTSLSAVADHPFVLLAPTEDYWKPEYETVLRAKKARFLALAEILDWNGKMSAKQPFEKLLPDLIEELAPAAEETTVFRREGDVWRIVFNAKAVSLKHSMGLACLHQLLKNPNQDIHAPTLQAAAAQAVLSAQGAAEAVHDADGDGEYSTAADQRDAIPAGSLLDKKALDQYKTRMEDIESEMREAEANNDTGRVAKLKSDFNLLSSEVGRATGLGGELRNNDDAERSRKAVSNAIRRAYVALKKKHPALEQHLQRSIKIAAVLSYRPEKPLNWVTSELLFRA